MSNFKTSLLRAYLLGKKLLLAAVICIAVIIIGCKKEISPQSEENPDNSISQSEKDLKINTRVHAGGSIQAAVNAASPGFVILIEPGLYNEAIVVNKPGIVLIGTANGVIIQNPGDKENGITVTSKAKGFVLKNVTIKNFEENGVFLDHVNGFILSNVKVFDNGDYGLFPLFCTNGIIDHCEASGHSDTGIYVGQSSYVSMSYNVAYANVNGLEVENSRNIIVNNNKSYNNVAGLIVVLLPGLDVKTASDILVYENNIYNNNHVNFATPGEGFESVIPSGVGILVLGTDKTLIRNNTVSGNNFTGIAVISTLVLGSLAGLPSSAFSDIEPNPDGNKIVRNVLHNNGSAPPSGLGFPGVDLLWDGSGSNNCWQLNIFNSSYPSPLPSCL
jgi:parallel beta-helix repeat protein